MRRIEFILIKFPRRLFHVIFYNFEFIYYRFIYTKPRLHIDFSRKLQGYFISRDENLKNIANSYNELFPNKVKTKIDEANLICEHIFNLLGSGPKKLSPDGNGYQPIDWHSDFKSGYRWNSKTFFRNIRYGNIEGVDVKVPWELSRFQHLNILGQAYLLTLNKKYFHEFINQISDWIENNPVGFGVNWECPMDVAIRAVNWLVAKEYFDSKEFSQDFLNNLFISIFEHGKFIREHLERFSRSTNNHYLANLAGLFFIAVYCPFFKESRQWQEFALKELSKEIDKQVYQDGCNFEGSTSYHRLALEIFFYSSLLAESAGVAFPEKCKNKIKKMFEFSLFCIKPNGLIPEIGDNDSGRFIIFSKRQILEHKYLLTLAAIYYKDSKFKLYEFDFDEEAFWVLGSDGIKIYDSLSFRKDYLSSKAFPDAGWYIIRHNRDYCFTSCRPNNQNGISVHTHNDRLSFELMIEGHEIIVDPGTYVYTPYPEERNKFRATEYHNTVVFNGSEQNEFSKKDIFSLPDEVTINEIYLEENANEIIFRGEIQYSGVSHKRIITLDKQSNSWLLRDSVYSEKPLNAKIIFHLSPTVAFNNNCIFSKKTGEKIATINTEGYKLEKEEYEYSPEYGVRMKAESLTANIPLVKDNQTINTYIRGLNETSINKKG